jgi:hypothetical protein
MIIAKISNGLGNQMFQYAAARALAARNGTGVKVDLTWFLYNKARRYGLSCFALRGKPANPVDILTLRGVRIKDWKGSTASDRLTKTHYIERGLTFDPSVLKFTGNTYLQGYFQSENYFIDEEETIREDFQFRHPLPGPYQPVLENMKAVESISMHIRRTDYGKAGLDQYVLSERYYGQALNYLSSKLQAPHAFVFSDDTDWVLANLRLPMPMTVVSCPGTRDYEELQLMSACKHHVIANSSFSWWGAWLNPRKDKIVVAPKRWLADHSRLDSSNLVPSRWVRI